jgi:hypothetical protein
MRSFELVLDISAALLRARAIANGVQTETLPTPFPL